MGILKSLFKSREPTKNQTIMNPYRFMFGGSSAGKSVTEQTAMQMTAVYSCVRVLSEAVAGLPLHFYQYRETGGKDKAMERPLYFLLHDEPNTEMTSFVFRETLMTHLLLWGNAYAQIIRNGKGEVVALYPLMPDKMTVNRDENKEIYYLYQADVGQVRLPKADVLHIPGLGFDGLVGYSPIAMAKNAIGLAIATEEYGSKFFANGANPGGVLEHPGTLKDPGKLRESWNATFGGSSNAAKVAVLEEGMKYTPISMSPEQAQFLETRKFQLEEIARIFRVPLHMVGDLDHATFSNVEHLSLDFVKFSLSPWLNRWEQALNKALLSRDEKRKYFIKFNVDGLLRGDYATRQQGYATGIQNGFLSPDDVRELEDLNPIPGGAGAKYYFNGNMLPIEQAGAAYGVNKEESEEDNQDEEVLEMGKSDTEESDDTRNDERNEAKPTVRPNPLPKWTNR